MFEFVKWLVSGDHHHVLPSGLQLGPSRVRSSFSIQSLGVDSKKHLSYHLRVRGGKAERVKSAWVAQEREQPTLQLLGFGLMDLEDVLNVIQRFGQVETMWREEVTEQYQPCPLLGTKTPVDCQLISLKSGTTLEVDVNTDMASRKAIAVMVHFRGSSANTNAGEQSSQIEQSLCDEVLKSIAAATSAINGLPCPLSNEGEIRAETVTR